MTDTKHTTIRSNISSFPARVQTLIRFFLPAYAVIFLVLLVFNIIAKDPTPKQLLTLFFSFAAGLFLVHLLRWTLLSDTLRQEFKSKEQDTKDIAEGDTKKDTNLTHLDWWVAYKLRDRALDLRMRAGLFLVSMVVLLLGGIYFIAYILPVEFLPNEAYLTGARITTLVVLLLLAQILARIYQYSLRLSAFWESRADAVFLSDSFAEEKAERFDDLVGALAPDAYDFKPLPKLPFNLSRISRDS